VRDFEAVRAAAAAAAVIDATDARNPQVPFGLVALQRLVAYALCKASRTFAIKLK